MGSEQSTHSTEQNLTQNSKRIKDLATVLDAKVKSQIVLTRTDNGQGPDCHKQDTESMRILKGLFKQLDPAIIHTPHEIHGQVQLSFKYDVKRQLLLVKLIKCNNLQAGDLRTKASAPYAKMFPDIHGHGTKTSQIVEGTRSPVYNEIFAFCASKSELTESQVVLQMWDHDLANQDDFLDLTITGELDLSLQFQPPHYLFITVHRACGLSPRAGHQSADPMIKSAIPGLGAYFSSQVQKNTLDPEWEESFEFEIPLEELSFRFITFDIVDSADLRSEKVVMGQAVFDLETLDTEKGFQGKLKLADLRNSAAMQNKLMQHVVTQEIREACLAHTTARLPHFLFGPLSGSKIVSVRCRKAGRKSAMKGHVHLVDGVPVY
ncbi:hypothetical protein C0Q70_15741 [Pomacea canaliculata]|uniref:C2 domain-containing protein n=1 Tax=Pomacea canaliculata TaxID=400727 RepID=A0A2T7NVQ3_POMCA|nr:hypothetical protein C0Q70_15741 [Pomacea canaliculata]